MMLAISSWLKPQAPLVETSKKDGSHACSHFLLKIGGTVSYLCYFPVWDGLAAAH